MELTPASALALWERAAESEAGISIEVSAENFRSAEKMLYEARKGREDLRNIRICFPAGGSEIFLVKDTVRMED